MSIFNNIFNKKPEATPAPVAPVTAAPVVAPLTPGNIPAVPAVAIDPNNPIVPLVPETTPAVKENESPLAEFSKIWDTDPNKKDEITNTPVPLDQAKVQELVAKADFSKNIPPEMLAAINEGGDGATAAMAQMMNFVAQQVMTQSIVANNKLNEKNIKDALAAQAAQLPDMLRQQQSADHLKSKNPIFTDPAIKPMIEAYHSQFLQKFPNETSTQITKRVEDLVLAMGEAFGPKPVVDTNTDGEQDWTNFLPEEQVF